MITIWITLFAVGSLLIAAIGQYSVIAFDMRRRNRDFAVRIALGASSEQMLASVLGQGFRWTMEGLAVGFVLSAAAGRAFRGLLVRHHTHGCADVSRRLRAARGHLAAGVLPARSPGHAHRSDSGAARGLGVD